MDCARWLAQQHVHGGRSYVLHQSAIIHGQVQVPSVSQGSWQNRATGSIERRTTAAFTEPGLKEALD